MAAKTECGIVLVVLCGLPGAGKTTLCHRLREYLSTKETKPFHVLHVCYDALIPFDIQEEITESPSGKYSPSSSDNPERTPDSCSWKGYRRLVLESVEDLVGKQTGNLCLKEDTSEHNRSIPGRFLSKFAQEIAEEGRACDCIPRNTKRWDAVCHVILIDDNMFYRSMRYEYFQLSRRYCLGFAEVYLECSTDLAQVRNSQRSTQVDDNTIQTMSTKIEAPEPEKFPWESFSLKLENSSSFDAGTLKLIEELIVKSAQNPVPPLVEEVDLEEKEASRTACVESKLYQADQTLRKHIGQVMATAKASGKTKVELRSLGNQLNKMRKMLLEEIRNVQRQSGVFCADDADNTADKPLNRTGLKILNEPNSPWSEQEIKDLFEKYSTGTHS